MAQPVQYYAKQPRNAAPQGGAYPQGSQGVHDGRVVGYGMRGAGQQQQPAPQQAPGHVAYGAGAGVGAQAQGQAQPPVQAQAQRQYAAAGQAARVGYGPQYAGYAQGAWQAQAQAGGAAGYQVPATSVPQQLQGAGGSRKKKRGAAFWVIIVLVVLCLAAAGLIAFNMLGHQSSRSGAPGQLEGKSPAEIQAELDRIVDEGMFNISIASVVQMANGSAPAELRIENVPGNPYLMKVAITLDDTGQTVYQTDAIEPNFHIQQDTLDVNLPAGTYDATAVFTALDPDTEEEVGQAAAKVQIRVQS